MSCDISVGIAGIPACLSYMTPENEIVRMSSISPIRPFYEFRLFVVVRNFPGRSWLYYFSGIRAGKN